MLRRARPAIHGGNLRAVAESWQTHLTAGKWQKISVPLWLEGKRHFSDAAASEPLASGSARDVVIVGAARTPFGSFQGELASVGATQLGSIAIKGALERAGVAAGEVQEVLMGNVLSAGLGQAPARQAALGAGLPPSTVCTAVNKVCSSGMKAVMLGAQSIALGLQEVVVAGGMESMSQAPHLLPRGLPARRTGALELRDSLEWDGLRDALRGRSMGALAESCAAEMSISREDQDSYAIESYQRAATAQATGILGTEIVAVETPGRRGKAGPTVAADQECSRFDPGRMRGLSPAFNANGTITAANASAISDGAAAVVLTSAAYAEKHGLKVLAKIRGYADAEQAPEKFPTAPARAIPLALRHAGLELKDAALFEVNEAFAVVVLANNRLLGLETHEVNIHGGAVALGHPIGASGARILIALITALAVRGEAVGVAAICNGGGGASAMVLERGPAHRLHRHMHDRDHEGHEEGPSVDGPREKS